LAQVDFDQLAGVDWIVEAIIEKLAIKRALVERLEAVIGEHTIVTTNTSGLPISQIVEGRSASFKQRFFGTHFLNPPRDMKLLEVIPGGEADPAAVDAIAEFATSRLGKGVVRCKDTPNFIGNRILSIHGSQVIDAALAEGYSLEEVDAVTGPLIGRPKTGTFRLQDLVGIDVSAFVGKNLHGLIPEDPFRDVLISPRLEKVIGGLIERGRLGNKTRQGFYKKGRDENGKKIFLVLDPETFDYREPAKVRFEAVGAVRKIEDLGERLQALFEERFKADRGARFAWQTVAGLLEYAAVAAQEIAFDLASIDNAVRWGFAHQAGPFELWDLLGVEATADRLEAEGRQVAPWVRDMLAAGCSSFYRRQDDRVIGFYDWHTKSYRDLERDPRQLTAADLHAAGAELAANDSASLLDMGDGVLLVEFHAKMNAIDDSLVAMINQGVERLAGDDWRAMVIGNDAINFCVGANLMGVGLAAQAGNFDAVDQGSRALQDSLMGVRYAAKPVVAAVQGMALGGGAEIALAPARIVASAEAYFGLVEAGVGLVPAGGGMKELVRRSISQVMRIDHADALPTAQKVLQAVGTAQVTSSAAEGKEWGFLAPSDKVVMHRGQLLWAAKQEALKMAAAGYRAPSRAKLYGGGRDLEAALRMVVWSMQQAGWASDHDRAIGDHLAYILAGGDASSEGWFDEQHFLDLERHAFVELLKTEKTQARIAHMLKTGKPLRN